MILLPTFSGRAELAAPGATVAPLTFTVALGCATAGETVIEELAVAAETVAHQLDGVQETQWQRPGRRSDGALFTVEKISRYMIHDPIHHIWDVTRTLRF